MFSIFFWMIFCFFFLLMKAKKIEYTGCTSAEGYKNPTPNKCPRYETKQSDGEVPIMLELWGMWNTPLLPSLPGPLRSGVVAPDKGPIYALNRTQLWFQEVTLFAFKLCIYAKQNFFLI